LNIPQHFFDFIKKNKWLIIAACLGVCLLLAGGIFLTRGLFTRIGGRTLFPGNQVVDFHLYYSIDPDVMGIILDDKRVVTVNAPFMDDDVVYVPECFIREYIDPFFFWDDSDQAVYVTTHTDILRFMPERIGFTLNGETLVLDNPVKRVSGVVYFPETLLMELYPFHAEYQPDYNLLVFTAWGGEPPLGEVINRTNIRYRPDVQTAGVVRAEKGTLVALYGEENGFTRVRTSEGLLGYALTADIEPREISREYRAREKLLSDYVFNTRPLTPMWPDGLKINMMWEDVHNPDAVALKMNEPIPDGVNVISPSFFKLGDDVLLESIASHEYVAWAHGQNVQVWAMLAGLSSEINHRAFANAHNRHKIVSQLAQYAREYNVDGINIDVEYLRAADGPYFIQFLRELAAEIRPQGIILSVDVLVPQAWSHFYRRDLIGLTADFICVMTYDEHYPGSPNSGPVASLPFVYKGVTDMLEMVPKNQLVMGLPFYNRIWIEQVNNDSPETRRVHHFGMERTKNLLTDNNVTPEWDAFVGSFYGQFAAVEDGETVLYRVWLEDERSIAEKLKIYEEHDLAGVAGWRRGFENEQTQRLLRDVVGR
jgi:hypothetical protein